MKLWTERLLPTDLHAACPRGVFIVDAAMVFHDPAENPRVKVRRFERVQLRSWHGTRYPNSGQYGAGSGEEGMAASYDEWGYWLAHLFALDRHLRANEYRGRADFHRQTNDKYRTVPASAYAAPTPAR